MCEDQGLAYWKLTVGCLEWPDVGVASHEQWSITGFSTESHFFLRYVNDVENGLKFIISQFTADMKVEGWALTTKECEVIQKHQLKLISGPSSGRCYLVSENEASCTLRLGTIKICAIYTWSNDE